MRVNSYGASFGLSKKVKYGQVTGGIVVQYGSSPVQTSAYYSRGGYAEAASWKREQISLLRNEFWTLFPHKNIIKTHT